MPVKIMFFISMLLGIIITVSSSSWITAWIGLEINLASFIPLMMNPLNKLPNESALKYFLTQSIASAFLMLSVLTPPTSLEWASLTTMDIPATMTLTALALKLGAAPLHFWFPPTMEGLSWMNCAILSTVQKMAPLMLLSSLTSPLNTLLASLSALVGALGGYGQLSLRKIMAFSSIGHLGWLLALMHFIPSMTLLYFSMYMYLTIINMQNFLQQNMFTISQTLLIPLNKNNLINFLNMLSLGGLPPFLGFLPKWLALEALIHKTMIILPGILIFSSLITLFYYMRIIYTISINSSSTLNPTIKHPPNTNILWSIPSITGFALLTPLLFM